MPDGRVTVLALMDTMKISGPCRGLFQLVKLSQAEHVRFVLGMFLIGGAATSSPIEEARCRGYEVATLTQRRRYDPGLILQAWRVMRRYSVQIIQSHSYRPAFIAWCLKRITGLPWIAFAHGYTSENKRMALYNRLDRWLLRHADRVVVVSGALKRDLAAAGVSPDKIHVIYNAIDSDDHAIGRDGHEFRRRCRVGPEELLVGVIGRLSPEKGHTVFIDAFFDVATVIPHAKAVFVGDGQELSRLKALVQSRGLEGRVIFAGHQPEMSSIYAGLDVVVIPSFSEGLPNVLLEAMLYGKPVVATTVGGIPEVMPAAWRDWLVRPADPHALAEKILEVLSAPEVGCARIRAGQEYVRTAFAPEARARQLAALYRDMAVPERAVVRTVSNPL